MWSPADESGRDPGRFATAEGLWEDLLTRGLRSPMFRLVRDGETLAPSQYCRPAGVGHRTLDDVVRPNRVVELHRQGATLVLQGLQLTDPHLGRFANNLALALDHPVQVNAYLTPRAATGLELHFDFHDVFVVQLAGRKRWRVWRPLVRTTDPVRRGPRLPMPTFEELGPPALDLTLTAGDCLYLPRGFPHAAEAVDAASSHLTVGVMAVTWQKVLTAAVDAALAEPGLRASLPAGVLGGVDPGRPALDALLAQLDPALVRAWLADEIWRRQPTTRLAPVVAPPAASRVRVTPGPLLWLRADGVRTVFGLGDRHLSLPGEAHGFLAALLAAPESFDVDGWAGALDAASRSVVVERLAAEGVVVPA